MKVAIVIFADTEHSDEGFSRVQNALEAALEFKNGGDEVMVIFDGAGTFSAAQIAKPEHELNFLFSAARSVIAGVCSFCAGGYEVRDEVQALGFELMSEFHEHQSFRKLLLQGYQVLTF